MRAQLGGSLAELVHNHHLLISRQSVHLLYVTAPVKRRVRAAAILYARADAVSLGLLRSLRALARDIGLDTLAGLEVSLQALGGQLLRGE
jgi:hypothetical protein